MARFRFPASVVVLAAVFAVALAADVPPCDSSVEDAALAAGASSCTRDLGRNSSVDPLYYLFMTPGDKFSAFCAQASCRAFLARIAPYIKTECTLFGVNVKDTLTKAQTLCVGPSDPRLSLLPSCGADILQLATGPYGSVCTSRSNGTDGTIVYSKLCTDSDCRVFIASLVKAYTQDCVVGGVSLGDYLGGIQQACPSLVTTAAPQPAVTTASPIITLPSASPTTAPIPTAAPVSSGSNRLCVTPVIMAILFVAVIGI